MRVIQNEYKPLPHLKVTILSVRPEIKEVTLIDQSPTFSKKILMVLLDHIQEDRFPRESIMLTKIDAKKQNDRLPFKKRELEKIQRCKNFLRHAINPTTQS